MIKVRSRIRISPHSKRDQFSRTVISCVSSANDWWCSSTRSCHCKSISQAVRSQTGRLSNCESWFCNNISLQVVKGGRSEGVGTGDDETIEVHSKLKIENIFVCATHYKPSLKLVPYYNKRRKDHFLQTWLNLLCLLQSTLVYKCVKRVSTVTTECTSLELSN